MEKFPWHTILAWYEQNGRHNLPWRAYFHLSEKDIAYHVWLAEVILQQTQASRASEYYERILEKYPAIESLASASYEEFFEYYKWLGYYSRARNMLRAAKIVTEEYEGIFPKDPIFLRKLPGVGPYTASAILAFAYDLPVLSFDTNLTKVFARYYHGSRFAKLSKTEIANIEADFRASDISSRTMNAALMDFASLVSTNSVAQVDWNHYPLTDCLFYRTHGAQEPEKTKKRAVFPTKDARIVVTLHENHRIYYSSQDNRYEPFILPPTEWDVRHAVQSYFRETHGLEVSVRPVHAKYYENDVPYVACNAQVQKWERLFQRYTRPVSHRTPGNMIRLSP